MNLLQYRYRAWIVPYAEGTLDPRRRAQLEAQLARDPSLAAEAEAERRVVARLREAAQSSEVAQGEKSLWPGIRSRLEPRHDLIRPLILVGGLSAAATSLAWAAFWGPLHHPSPEPASVPVTANTPSVIVVEASSGHRHGHSIRRSRPGGEHLAKRLAAPVSRLEREDRPDESRTAHNDATPTPENGTATAPPLISGDASRFHLATTVRPLENDAVAENEALGQTTPREDPKAQQGDGVDGKRDGEAGPMGTAAETPTLGAAREQALPQRRHAHRSRRRHARRSDGKPVVSRSTEATDTSTSAVAPNGNTPPHPKPID